MLTKAELEKIMMKEIGEIVSAWNYDGILFEDQFESIYSMTIKENKTEIYEIIQEHGGIDIEVNEDSDGLPLVGCVQIENRGPMLYLYNPDKFDSTIAEKIAHKYFIEK